MSMTRLISAVLATTTGLAFWWGLTEPLPVPPAVLFGVGSVVLFCAGVIAGRTGALAAPCALVFSLLLGRRRSPASKAVLAAVAAAITTAVAGSRVLLGVHWFTDVVAGIAIGWAWFTLISLAFGGRILRFGAPVAQAEAVQQSLDSPSGPPRPTPSAGR